MSDHQMCGISRESSNTSSRSEPAAKLIIVRVVSSGSSLNYTSEMIYPLRRQNLDERRLYYQLRQSRCLQMETNN